MFDSIVAHTPSLDFTLIDGIFDRFPAFLPARFPTVWTVDKEQVDVAQPTLLQRLLDWSTSCIIACVDCELGGEEDVFALEGGRVATAGEERKDRGANLPFVLSRFGLSFLLMSGEWNCEARRWNRCMLRKHAATILGFARRAKRSFTVYLPDRPVLSRYYYTLSNDFNTKVDCSRRLTLDSLPIAFSNSTSSAYTWVELHVPPMPIWLHLLSRFRRSDTHQDEYWACWSHWEATDLRRCCSTFLDTGFRAYLDPRTEGEGIWRHLNFETRNVTITNFETGEQMRMWFMCLLTLNNGGRR